MLIHDGLVGKNIASPTKNQFERMQVLAEEAFFLDGHYSAN